jgi:hypothetical protein
MIRTDPAPTSLLDLKRRPPRLLSMACLAILDLPLVDSTRSHVTLSRLSLNFADTLGEVCGTNECPCTHPWVRRRSRARGPRRELSSHALAVGWPRSRSGKQAAMWCGSARLPRDPCVNRIADYFFGRPSSSVANDRGVLQYWRIQPVAATSSANFSNGVR